MEGWGALGRGKIGPLCCCDPEDSDKGRRGIGRLEALRTGSGQP